MFYRCVSNIIPFYLTWITTNKLIAFKFEWNFLLFLMRKCPTISFFTILLIFSGKITLTHVIISEFCFISLSKQFCEGNQIIFLLPLFIHVFNHLSTYYMSSAVTGTKSTMGNNVNEVFFLIMFAFQWLLVLFLAGLEFCICILLFLRFHQKFLIFKSIFSMHGI